MAATPGEVPAWLQDDQSDFAGDGEDVSLGPSGVSSPRQYHDYTQPPDRRRRCVKRCVLPLVGCLVLVGLALGLTWHFTGKNPSELANSVDEWAEENLPGMGGKGDDGANAKPEYSDEPTDFIFFADDFENEDELPSKFLSSGDGESPRLDWKNLPNGTKSLVLFFDEPFGSSGETTYYWVAYDIPPEADGLQEGLPNSERVELIREDTEEGNGGNDIFMLQGLNSWGVSMSGDDEDGGAVSPPVGSYGYRPPDLDDGEENEGMVRILYFRLLALKEKLDGSLDPAFATPQEVRKEASDVLLSELSLQVSLK